VYRIKSPTQSRILWDYRWPIGTVSATEAFLPICSAWELDAKPKGRRHSLRPWLGGLNVSQSSRHGRSFRHRPGYRGGFSESGDDVFICDINPDGLKTAAATQTAL
jgi:hypothetical protein